MGIGLVNGGKEVILVKNIVKTEKINHLILLMWKVEDQKVKRIRKKIPNLLQKVQDLNQIQVLQDRNLKGIIIKKIKRNKENKKINILLKTIERKIKRRTNKARKNKQRAKTNTMKAQIQDLFLDNHNFLRNKDMKKRDIMFKKFLVQHTQIQINLLEQGGNNSLSMIQGIKTLI
jgi:hypothetical protein